MMLVIVEFELAPGQEDEFETLLGEMQERVKQYDGYLGEEPCRSLLDENRFITLFRFRDQAAIASWKQDAEHLRTQRLGRERVFAWYRICVSEIQREYGFNEPTP